MNNYQDHLYRELKFLADTREAFYYVDQELHSRYYRIFLYRLANYTDWIESPVSFESRGTTFEMNLERGGDFVPVRLVSLPFEKFFNYRENPFTEEVNWDEAIAVENKMDGSLISTYTQNGEVYLKTKGSLSSPQANDANDWIGLEENAKFRSQLKNLAMAGYTVMMEWTAPHNRIVIGYMKPSLSVLAIRDNNNGKYVDGYLKYSLRDAAPDVAARWNVDVTTTIVSKYGSIARFIEHIKELENIEGYVILLPNQRVKIKTEWYMVRHHIKDSVNCPRRLFEAVLDEATDDMHSLFYDDDLALKQIADMEKFATELYNKVSNIVEMFYEKNQDLTRKEYAILAQKTFRDNPTEGKMCIFGLIMSRYLGKDTNIKAFLKKNWRNLGLKDSSQTKEE